MKGDFIKGYKGFDPDFMVGVWISMDGLSGTWFGEFVI